jgi:hypothetical protein
MSDESRREEPGRRGDVSANRDVHLDDGAASVDSALHGAPHTGNLDVGLVEPATSDHMWARSRRVDQQPCESLHPAVQPDVIDLNTTLSAQFLEVPERPPEPQVPTHRQQDDLRREPEPGKR